MVSGGKGNLIVVIMIISTIKIILIIITMTVTAVTTADKNYDKKNIIHYRFADLIENKQTNKNVVCVLNGECLLLSFFPKYIMHL